MPSIIIPIDSIYQRSCIVLLKTVEEEDEEVDQTVITAGTPSRKLKQNASVAMDEMNEQLKSENLVDPPLLLL